MRILPGELGSAVLQVCGVGGFLAVSGLAGVTALLLGSLKTGTADAVLGTLLAIGSLEGLYRWCSARRPLVVVEDEALVWRSGLSTRRHALNDLALFPDPFDLTVLRLQTRGGRFLRLPRDGVAKAAKLERLLQARLESTAAGGGANAPTGELSDEPRTVARQDQ